MYWQEFCWVIQNGYENDLVILSFGQGSDVCISFNFYHTHCVITVRLWCHDINKYWIHWVILSIGKTADQNYIDYLYRAKHHSNTTYIYKGGVGLFVMFCSFLLRVSFPLSVTPAAMLVLTLCISPFSL